MHAVQNCTLFCPIQYYLLNFYFAHLNVKYVTMLESTVKYCICNGMLQSEECTKKHVSR